MSDDAGPPAEWDHNEPLLACEVQQRAHFILVLHESHAVGGSLDPTETQVDPVWQALAPRVAQPGIRVNLD